MDIQSFLYDAAGADTEVQPEDVDIRKLKEKQLLWINVLKRDDETLHRVAEAVKLEGVPFHAVTQTESRPRVEIYENFFRFRISSVEVKKDKRPKSVIIDYIVGRNFLVTVHEGDIGYFQEFRKREKGETNLGELDAESFLATLLDLHIVSYFQAMEEVERRVDKFDEDILKRMMNTDEFLSEMVQLRRDVSDLRRWLLPHRDVFYSLTRADFRQIAESDSVDEFSRLNEHFENACDAIEGARGTVLSIFELYSTKAAQQTNHLIRQLTFFTLVVGSLGVIAGIFGMNYQLSYFESEAGFWFTVGAMGFIAASWAVVAKIRGWL